MNEHKKPTRILAIESKNLKIILTIMIINFSYYEKLVLAFQFWQLRLVILAPSLVPTGLDVSDASVTSYFASYGYLEAHYKKQQYKYTLSDDFESLFYCALDVMIPH